MRMKLEAITQAFLEDPWFDVQDPLEINCGDCYRWAYTAYLIYGGTLYSFENKYLAHAFIKIKNKYYDSESPDGESDWKHLKFFLEDRPSHIFNTTPIAHESEAEFFDYWNFKSHEVRKVLKRSKEIIKLSKNKRKV